ncbi:DUF6894 family protein [Devosia salina]|uniref:DUF6894 domain-containing protein n=1 Tax=Devosia salina TaxID=2860336 RepID=A0ABX8WAU5_9HYPH|nr:hypothetical protein [Devosia salina]QYO75076.1 hypothetical protein K1X15_10370 [Devosia salina]
MAWFFFEVQRAGEDPVPDLIGGEFDTIERARQEASNALYEMAMDVKPGSGPTSIQITVKNELGQIVARRTARFESEDIEP